MTAETFEITMMRILIVATIMGVAVLFLSTTFPATDEETIDMRIPKKKPARNDEYLEYIRSLPCCVCVTGTPVEPHHMEGGGVGQKGSDYSCIPLCTQHHRELHDVGVDHFQCDKVLNLWMMVFKCVDLWMREVDK